MSILLLTICTFSIFVLALYFVYLMWVTYKYRYGIYAFGCCVLALVPMFNLIHQPTKTEIQTYNTWKQEMGYNFSFDEWLELKHSRNLPKTPKQKYLFD